MTTKGLTILAAVAAFLVIAAPCSAQLNFQSSQLLAGSGTSDNRFPQIAGDGQGDWVAVWTGRQVVTDPIYGDYLGDADIYSAYSHDNGATWSTPARVNAAANADGQDDMRPTIAYSGRGTWMVVWESYDSLNDTIGYDSDLLVSTSTDGGVSWTTPAPLFPTLAASDTTDDAAPRIATDRLGNWVVVWEATDPVYYDTDIYASTSTDGGQTWSTPMLVDPAGYQDTVDDTAPAIDTDGRGRWGVTWLRSENDSDNVYFAYGDLGFGGLVWTTPRLMNDPALGGAISLSTVPLAADGFNTWMVLWSRQTPTSLDVVVTRSTDSGATWSAVKKISATGLVDVAFSPELAADRSGNWVAGWWAYSTTQLGWGVYGSRSTDRGATWSSPQATFSLSDASTTFGDPFALASDRKNTWMLTYDLTTIPTTQVSGAKATTTLPTADLYVTRSTGIAQADGSLTGEITAQGTGEALTCATAVVTLPGTDTVITVATTGVDGTYYVGNLPPGTYSVQAASPGFAAQTKSVTIASAKETKTNFALLNGSGGTVITGRVTDQDGGWPLGGAKVTARTGETVLAQTYTCAEGYFELVLPVGAKQGTVTVEVTAPNFETETQEVSPGSDVTVEMKSLTLPNQVTGVITGAADSKAIAGAQVTVKEVLGSLSLPRTTDTDGSYVVANLADGEYEVTATADGFAGETSTVTVNATAPIGRVDLALAKGGNDGGNGSTGCAVTGAVHLHDMFGDLLCLLGVIALVYGADRMRKTMGT